MEPRAGIEVCALADGLLAEAARLLALYVHGEDAAEAHLGAAREALERFRLNPSALFWLARADGRSMGFISLAWSVSTSRGAPVLRVEGLYTLPEYRRSEVATTLLERAVEVAHARGANRLQLETDIDNLAARRLYERLGFECFPRKQVYMRFL